eukprot:TRINITY_DN15931_c0_g1_i1.p3 TRINITY_DN15931_c0_g1~~TRINITY_DN15931_c0_g1_i1.p3  ORF type:complete len:103 (-),score=10.37 TRINITY_DN15931_c0_g1_i1:451-759(-)
MKTKIAIIFKTNKKQSFLHLFIEAQFTSGKCSERQQRYKLSNATSTAITNSAIPKQLNTIVQLQLLNDCECAIGKRENVMKGIKKIYGNDKIKALEAISMIF